ncbi:hypothetical protein ACTL6P_24380 [Endozoicomonas acroporae]|uniref:hypothetical protein n=1 Tax=Endozoicomonas acroporae TaxID=1701104 RepID=UPI000C7901F3|nr:hypothetical protein [Endozoicomonas acroporae]
MLNRFPLNAPLRSIGTIHTKNWFSQKLRPKIEVDFEGHPSNAVPAELIPMLVEGCTYNNKKRFSPENRQERKVVFDSYQGKIVDQTGRNILVYACGKFSIAIPAIELARTLYLHNTHLTRTALRPNGLQGLATIESGQHSSTITFNRLSDFSVSNLKNRSAQAHLIWLLFDERARKGFNSIYDALVRCEASEWFFDFEPPPLKGWIANVVMPAHAQDEDIYYVNEITALHNPSFFYQNEVLIFHPNLKKTIRVDPEDKSRPVVNKPDQDSLLDLQSIPKLGRKRDVVSEVGFSFTFGNETPSQLVLEKQEHKISPVVMQQFPMNPGAPPPHSIQRRQ